MSNRVPKAQRPRFNGDDLRAALSVYDRRPFIDLLAEFIECTPDPSTIKEFADKAPDKFVSSLGVLSRMAGFTEKTETLVDINVNLRSLSDSQIEDRLQKLTAAMGATLELPPARNAPATDVASYAVEADVVADNSDPEGNLPNS